MQYRILQFSNRLWHKLFQEVAKMWQVMEELADMVNPKIIRCGQLDMFKLPIWEPLEMITISLEGGVYTHNTPTPQQPSTPPRPPTLLDPKYP